MRYSKEYVTALEELITEKLLPAYIEHCRRASINPNTNEIIKELLLIMKKKRDVPFLLKAR
jgi:hypothetical protein